MMQSELEATFERLWSMIGPKGCYELHEEMRFHDVKKWRFDFAIPTHMVAIELEGLGGGRHQRTGGFIADCDKYNAATALGWRVLRFTTRHLASDPHGVMETIEQTLTFVENKHD